MKNAIAGLLTLFLVGGLAYQAMRSGPRNAATSSPDVDAANAGSPEVDPLAGASQRVRSLLGAARAGDVDAYLAAFTSEARRRLEQQVAESGHVSFAGQLRRAAETRKSHALYAPTWDGSDNARVVLEAVYPDRNERQTFGLVRDDGAPGGWLITGVETVATRVPASKYGSYATFEGPEGVPVQQGAAPAP